MTQEIATQEESKVQKDAHAEWLPNQFNYGASLEQMAMIQERVQARVKDGTVLQQLIDSTREAGIVKDGNEETIKAFAIQGLYLHTAFEVGKENGLHDLSNLVDEVFETAKNTDTETGLEKEEK